MFTNQQKTISQASPTDESDSQSEAKEDDYSLSDLEPSKTEKPSSNQHKENISKMPNNTHVEINSKDISIQIPPHVNAYRLANLFDIEPDEILKQISLLTNELVADEFQIISEDTIDLLAVHFEKEIEFIKDASLEKNYKVRPPVVTIMGHVDHGKTTLLDAFRHSQRVKEEYGDITQSIGAFTFITDSNHQVTFIDTPGHEAFNNLRLRGAKITDIIILVISAIESVQPQTIEVIEIAQMLKIPLIVAINKIDRPAADVEAVLLDLSSRNLVPEDLGGDVICVPISAKMKTNLDKLEQKIIEVAEKRVKLKEDFSINAQCFIVESNIDEKSHQITATILVKKGTLRQDDIFVCGPHEGRVRFMKNDQGQNIKEAYPGQAVLLGGFRHFPDVGAPLYGCTSHEEALFMMNRTKLRREREELQLKSVDTSQILHDMKKKVKGLSRIEKRKLYGGDKTIMYEKMGLIEESDIEKYRKKLGIAKNVDLINKDIDDVEQLIETASAAAPKRRKSGSLAQRKKEFEKEEFKKILQDFKEEKQKKELMEDDERERYEIERQKLKEVFRGDDVKHFPLIIKSNTAGTLETLLKEAEKIIGTNYRINIIDYAVGPISEGDLTSAAQTGAVIIGFDVPCAPAVQRTAEQQGVIVRQHKIIYKFLDDIEHYVHDAKITMQEEQGKAVNIEVLGEAHVLQLFTIKDTKNKGKMITVIGCRVDSGELERKNKYRLIRDGKVIVENLKLHSMKKLQQDATKIEKGHECGISFDGYDGEIKPQDVIEAYKEIEGKNLKFNHKPGVHTTY